MQSISCHREIVGTWGAAVSRREEGQELCMCIAMAIDLLKKDVLSTSGTGVVWNESSPLAYVKFEGKHCGVPGMFVLCEKMSMEGSRVHIDVGAPYWKNFFCTSYSVNEGTHILTSCSSTPPFHFPV